VVIYVLVLPEKQYPIKIPYINQDKTDLEKAFDYLIQKEKIPAIVKCCLGNRTNRIAYNQLDQYRSL
jgi:thiamine pyrophosphokinase